MSRSDLAVTPPALALPTGKRRQSPVRDIGGFDSGQRLADLPSLRRSAARERPSAPGEPEQHHIGGADGFPRAVAIVLRHVADGVVGLARTAAEHLEVATRGRDQTEDHV